MTDPTDAVTLPEQRGDIEQAACIFPGCVSRDRHWHGGFPGGYTDPADPEGPPILFTTEPAPGVRDYNGALLPSAAADPDEGVYQDSQNTDPQYRTSAAVAPDKVPTGPFYRTAAEIEQAAEAASREAAGHVEAGDVPTSPHRPSAAVAPLTSSAEVGGSLDVEALAAAAQSSHHSWWDHDQQGGHTDPDWRRCTEWPCAPLAAYTDAIRKRGGA